MVAGQSPTILPVLLVLGLYAARTLRSYPSFDGALNLNVARSVAEGRGYGFAYDSFFAFPAQTDGPFVLPSALLFRLFGVGLVTSQLISLLYLAAFALLVAALLRRLGAPPWLAAAGSLACLLTPGVGDFGVGGYGEIPMLSWLLSGFLAAANRRFGWSGLLFGMAMLTKTVALLCVAPAWLACAVFICTSGPGRRRHTLGLLTGGLLLPLFGWELFRLAELGSPSDWWRWWTLQLGQVGRQSGAAEFSGLAPAIAKLRLHLAYLSHDLAVPPGVLWCWLTAPWLLASIRLCRRRTPRDQALLLWLLLLCAVLYAVWWLLVTPDDMAWLRRILVGLLLQTCLIAALIPAPRTAPGAGWRTADAMLPALVLLLLVLPGEAMTLRTGLQVSPRPASESERRDTDRLAAALRALPDDAVIFGFGWWQAPLLALLSDRWFMNFYLWTPAAIDALPNRYLVVDRWATSLGGDQLLDVERQATLVPLQRGHDMALYRIVTVDPDRALDDPAPLTTGFDGTAVAQTSGWYRPDNGWAWVSPRSRIRLGRSDQTRLVIDGAFWDELFVHGPRRLRVEAAGCIEQTVIVPSSGARRLVLPLRCAPSPTVVPITLSLSIDGALPRPHQLDADTRRLAFQVHRLMLER